MAEHTIPTSTKKVDGGGNFSHVQPGDILVIPEDRGLLRLVDLAGTEEAPVIVTIKRPITIDAAGEWLCIELDNCQHVRLTGETEAVEYGIRCINFTNSGVNARKGTQRVEIDHIEIGPGTDRAAGIRWSSDVNEMESGWVQHDTHIHDCYIHDTPKTALYIGTTPSHDGTPLAGVKIHHNLIRNIGREGVQLRYAVRGVEVHHNHIERVGLEESDTRQSGAGLSIEELATGRWYCNVIVDCTQGVMIHKAGEGLEVYNNIFARCGYHLDRTGGGIRWFVSHESARVYNNTVVGGKDFGVRVSRNVRGQLFNNLVVASQLSLADDGVQAVGNLQIDQIEAARFVDPDRGDYHLKGGSPAVGAASSDLFPNTDMDGRSRPVGPRPDVGAYEFAKDGPAPGPGLTAIAQELNAMAQRLTEIAQELE